MKNCPNCGKKILSGMTQCPYCKRPTKDTPARKIPVATAIIALVFIAVIIFGVAIGIITRIRETPETDSDTALHLDGVWATQGPTVNDEHITYVFDGDTFSRVTERTLFDANPEALRDFIDYYASNYRATVDAEDIGDGNYFIRIYVSGMFALDGANILIFIGDGPPVVYSFYWDGVAIIIGGDRFYSGD